MEQAITNTTLKVLLSGDRNFYSLCLILYISLLAILTDMHGMSIREGIIFFIFKKSTFVNVRFISIET